MARSVWKGPFVELSLLKKAEDAQEAGGRAPIKTWSRRSTILPQFVGLTFNVYNGHKFIPVSVSEDMVGHKLGEFSPTRSFPGHAADKKGKRDWASRRLPVGLAKTRRSPSAPRSAVRRRSSTSSRRSFVAARRRRR